MLVCFHIWDLVQTRGPHPLTMSRQNIEVEKFGLLSKHPRFPILLWTCYQVSSIKFQGVIFSSLLKRGLAIESLKRHLEEELLGALSRSFCSAHIVQAQLSPLQGPHPGGFCVAPWDTALFHRLPQHTGSLFSLLTGLHLGYGVLVSQRKIIAGQGTCPHCVTSKTQGIS